MIPKFMAFAASFLSLTAASAASNKPNILVIMVDDLGWNHHSVQSSQGRTRPSLYHTPNLDKLAKEGLRFTNAYTQPNCAPTRAAMLTGQYPARTHNQVYAVGHLNRFGEGEFSKKQSRFIGPKQKREISVKALTIATALKASGYATAHFGKFHVGGHKGPNTLPQNRGFDLNIGGGAAGNQQSCFATHGPQGWHFKGTGYGALDAYAKPYDKNYLEKYQLPEQLQGSPKHITDALTDAVEEAIAKLSLSPKPFYLQMHTWAVHSPVQARPDLYQAATHRLKQSGKTHPKASYLAFVSGVDQALGRIIQRLDDPNGDGQTRDSILDKTLVLFTSDNGGTHASNAPLRGFKGEFYDGGIRVPLFAYWKGSIPAGSICERLIHSVDFFPSYLDLANGLNASSAEPYLLDGYSFAPLLKDPRKKTTRPPIFYLFPGYLDSRATPLVCAIQNFNGSLYKLIYFWQGDRYELYNLTEDPGERKNLADSKATIVAHLANLISNWLEQKDPTWQPQFPIDKQSGIPVSFDPNSPES